MKQILVWVVLLSFSLSIFTPNTAHAAESEESPFIYNLDEGGRQEFSAVTEDDEKILVVIEEVFSEQKAKKSQKSFLFESIERGFFDSTYALSYCDSV